MTTTISPASMQPNATRISVVLPVFNGGADLDRCLAAIAASSYPVFETILVDDGSTDGATQAAGTRHDVRVVTLDEQRGPACARNVGAGKAGGDVIFFTDADVLLHPDALGIAVGALDADPMLGAVFGSYDDQPGHNSFLSQYRNLFHHWVHQTGHEEAFTFWTGCGAIRRSIFLQIGGFDEGYLRPSIEDIELGSRLRRAGVRIRLEKTLFGKHMKHWKFWNMLQTDIFRRGVPWMALVLREGQAPKDLNLSLNSRVATILAGVLGLSSLLLPVAGHPNALWPALVLLLAGVLSARYAASPASRAEAPADSPAADSSGRKPGAGAWLAITLGVLGPFGAYWLAPDPLAMVPLILVLALAGTQRAFYRYVIHKRGAAFALAVIPMQVLFFLGCAAAVPFGFFQHWFGHHRAPTRVVKTSEAE